jgi:hypothetical protein
MAKTTLGCLLLAGSLAGLLPGATTLTGPFAGYVVAPSGREMRAILGVPGSFRFSDPLALPREVTGIHLAPTHNFALVERGGAGVAILVLDGAAGRIVEVDGAASGADWVAFSPSAGSAILYSSAANRLQVWSGLPDAPRVLRDMDAANLPETPALGGVSDDAVVALVASRRAVYFVPDGGPARLLLSAGDIASLAMLRNGSAAVSDRATGSVRLLRNIASAPEARVLVSGLDGIGDLYASSDGSSVFAARPAANLLSLIDLASGEVRDFETDAAPLLLLPLRNRDTFLISAQPQEPGWVFYRDGSAGRVVFVPAVKESDDAIQRGRRR